MARITSELAALQIGSRYDLILIASRRVRELRRGDAARITHTHRSEIVTALREIEQGMIGRDYLLKNPDLARDHKRRTR